MQPEQLKFFARFIEKELGIIYSETNYFQLQNRLEEISRILGYADVTALTAAAQKGIPAQMKQLILDVATNNETSFYRDPKIFHTIRDVILPSLIPNLKAGRGLRVWSAACSSGQEPYSLAMLFHEQASTKDHLSGIQIVATDISSRVLEKAQKGRYTQLEAQRGLAAPYLIKYFQKDGDDHWVLKPEVRNLIKFQTLNLLESFDSMGKFDLILCRNVLIYQNVENKIKIIKKLASRLNPGGHFVMGAGESMIGLSDDFDIVRGEGAIVYRLKTAAGTAAA